MFELLKGNMNNIPFLVGGSNDAMVSIIKVF